METIMERIAEKSYTKKSRENRESSCNQVDKDTSELDKTLGPSSHMSLNGGIIGQDQSNSMSVPGGQRMRRRDSLSRVVSHMLPIRAPTRQHNRRDDPSNTNRHFNNSSSSTASRSSFVDTQEQGSRSRRDEPAEIMSDGADQHSFCFPQDENTKAKEMLGIVPTRAENVNLATKHRKSESHSTEHKGLVSYEKGSALRGNGAVVKKAESSKKLDFPVRVSSRNALTIGRPCAEIYGKKSYSTQDDMNDTFNDRNGGCVTGGIAETTPLPPTPLYELDTSPTSLASQAMSSTSNRDGTAGTAETATNILIATTDESNVTVEVDLGKNCMLHQKRGAKGKNSLDDIPRDTKHLIIKLLTIKVEVIGSDTSNDVSRKFAHASCLQQLVGFRNLKSLVVTGMTRSGMKNEDGESDRWQKYIWLTVWLNPGLKYLRLSFMSSVDLNKETTHSWTRIDEKWPVDRRSTGDTPLIYHGKLGDGKIHDKYGSSEYFDSMAIGMAKAHATELVGVNGVAAKIGLRVLHLTGMVVSNRALVRFFDLSTLKIVRFGHGCIDAGIQPQGMPVKFEFIP